MSEHVSEVRQEFVKYMRTGYAYGEEWTDLWGTHSSTDIRESIKRLSETDPMLYRVFNLYTLSRMSRHRIAVRLGYDYSTVKRKLDQAIDIVLTMLANLEINKVLLEQGHEII
jgi:hypothetical protein